jgi:hypothetical protein
MAQRAVELFEAGQHDMVAGVDGGLPARLDDDGLVGFDDQRRALEAVAGLSRSRRIDRAQVPFAIGIDRAGFTVWLDPRRVERAFGFDAGLVFRSSMPSTEMASMMTVLLS